MMLLVRSSVQSRFNHDSISVQPINRELITFPIQASVWILKHLGILIMIKRKKVIKNLINTKLK